MFFARFDEIVCFQKYSMKLHKFCEVATKMLWFCSGCTLNSSLVSGLLVSSELTSLFSKTSEATIFFVIPLEFDRIDATLRNFLVSFNNNKESLNITSYKITH